MEHVGRANLAHEAGGVFALLPEDVLGDCLVVVGGFLLFLVDVFVLELASAVASEFVARVAEFAGVEFTVLCTVVTVVGVFRHFALRFFVEWHVVREGRGAVDLEALELRLGVERPALFELARIAPVAPPRVLHDPEAFAVVVVAPAEAFDCVAAWLVPLVCGRFVDSGADALHLRVDRHADDHRAVFDELGLDFSGSSQSDVRGSFASTAHFV